jgi:hypothetical protein
VTNDLTRASYLITVLDPRKVLMLQDEHSIPTGGPVTFALLACGCRTFYVGHDIAPGDPVICPSPARCAGAVSRWTIVTSTLVGTVQPTDSRAAA